MDVTDDGMVGEDRLMQLANAYDPMDVTDEGIAMERM